MSINSYSYTTMTLTSAGCLTIPNDVNFVETCDFTESLRNTPFLEIIVQVKESDTYFSIYNNFLSFISAGTFICSTSNGDEIIIPDSSLTYYKLININDKRFYVYDKYLSYINKSYEKTPSNLYFTPLKI